MGNLVSINTSDSYVLRYRDEDSPVLLAVKQKHHQNTVTSLTVSKRNNKQVQTVQVSPITPASEDIPHGTNSVKQNFSTNGSHLQQPENQFSTKPPSSSSKDPWQKQHQYPASRNASQRQIVLQKQSSHVVLIHTNQPSDSAKINHNSTNNLKSLSAKNKQASMSNIPNTSSKLGSNHIPLSRQQTQTLPASTSNKNNNNSPSIQCSTQYPWLIKSCVFSSNSNNNQNFLNDFEAGKVIGKGLMGTVRITKLKNQEKYFVLKSIRKDYIVRHNDMRHVTNEKNILYSLQSHPFCVSIFGTFQDRQNIYFALQYVPGGELYKRLNKVKRFSGEVAKFYVTEIASTLSYLHSQHIVYRDLKPENILIDEDGHCKIVDFGFAIRTGKTEDGEDEKMHTLCGTPAYLSPEQLDGKLTNGYTKIVDWWSFGVLIFELLTGKTPFCRSSSESHYEIFLRIISQKHIKYPHYFEKDAKSFVNKLCHVSLTKRLVDPDEILKNPYFQVNDWQKINSKLLVPPYVPRLKDKGDVHYFDSYYSDSNIEIHQNETNSNYDYFDF